MDGASRWSTNNWWILVLGLLVALLLCACMCLAAAAVLAPALGSVLATPVVTVLP